MLALEELKAEILTIESDDQFNRLALQLFDLHLASNPVFQAYISSLPKKYAQPSHYSEITCLPIDFFKSKQVQLEGIPYTKIFESSGTTGSNTSRHYVNDTNWYIKQSIKNFEAIYGDLENFNVLALLPSYLERDNSSLVYMADAFIAKSKSEFSGFYLNEIDELKGVLTSLSQRKGKTLLLGVSFALVDLCEGYDINFPELIVMETGGMKGRRKEMIRKELHAILKDGFHLDNIHSEYGMTELLSQAYSRGEGIFETPPWMKIMIRDTNDPLSYVDKGFTGGISVIDLANIESCPFIATQDLAKIHPHGIEILGRFDHSDIRGCSLLTI